MGRIARFRSHPLTVTRQRRSGHHGAETLPPEAQPGGRLFEHVMNVDPTTQNPNQILTVRAAWIMTQASRPKPKR